MGPGEEKRAEETEELLLLEPGSSPPPGGRVAFAFAFLRDSAIARWMSTAN